MMKLVLAAAFTAVIGVSQAAAQSLVQRSNWQDRKFETYLPRDSTSVPWLEINTKTRPLKGDIPLGRDVALVGPFVWPKSAAVQVSTDSFSTSETIWPIHDGKWVDLNLRRPGTRPIHEASRQME